MIFTRALLVSMLVGILANCGGGSSGGSSSGIDTYSGSSTPATVSDSNKTDLADAARHATAYTLEDGGEQPSLPYGASVQTTDLSTIINDAAQLTASSQSSTPSAYIETYNCEISGSITWNFVGVSQNTQTIPENGTFIIDYDNCVNYQGDEGINGTMEFTYRGYSEEQYFYQEYDVAFDISYGGYSYSGVASCSNFGETCRFSEDYSIGGVSYRVEDSSVSSGSTIDTYNVTATVYHETEGYIVFSATDVMIDSSGNVCSGSIEVYNSSQEVVLSVEFPDCNTYILTYNGVAETYSQ